ncbi:MAG: HAMP domain-containing protein [Phycisphaerae bacterium]|nr:HAMP domain-containing protein [Phycisphaerae bacterium]
MNLSLSNKVTWVLVAVLGLSLLTVGAYAVREQESLAQDLMRKWVSQSSSRYLAALGQALADSDVARVTETAKALVTAMPVAYCEVQTQQGEVIFQEGPILEHPVASFVWPVPHYDAQGVVQTMGRLTLVLSPGPMTVAVSRIGQTISLAGLGTLLLGLVLGSLAIRFMLGRPLAQLVDGANRVVHQGDLQHRIEFDRNDEIGLLANAINTLTDELRGVIRQEKALTQCVDQEFKHSLALHDSLTQEDSSLSKESVLVMMKEMIEQSGGEFWIKSEEGKGRVFHFTLPPQTSMTDIEEKGVCK